MEINEMRDERHVRISRVISCFVTFNEKIEYLHQNLDISKLHNTDLFS